MWTLLLAFTTTGVVVLAVLGAYVLAALKRQRGLRDVGEELGLPWHQDGPFDMGELVGDMEGFAVTARSENRGLGSFARQAMTVDVALVPALPFAGEVRKEDSVSRAAGSVGAKDVRTGDPAFDEMFLVDVTDLADFLELFDEDLRRAARAFAESADDVLILPTRLRWYRYDPNVAPEDLVHAIRATVVLADHMRRRRARQIAGQASGHRKGPSPRVG